MAASAWVWWLILNLPCRARASGCILDCFGRLESLVRCCTLKHMQLAFQPLALVASLMILVCLFYSPPFGLGFDMLRWTCMVLLLIVVLMLFTKWYYYRWHISSIEICIINCTLLDNCPTFSCLTSLLRLSCLKTHVRWYHLCSALVANNY